METRGIQIQILEDKCPASANKLKRKLILAVVVMEKARKCEAHSLKYHSVADKDP